MILTKKGREFSRPTPEFSWSFQQLFPWLSFPLDLKHFVIVLYGYLEYQVSITPLLSVEIRGKGFKMRMSIKDIIIFLISQKWNKLWVSWNVAVVERKTRDCINDLEILTYILALCFEFRIQNSSSFRFLWKLWFVSRPCRF